VRRRSCAVSNHESLDAAILRDAASRLLPSEHKCAHPGMRTFFYTDTA
jgi:hypothetical protein